MQGINVIGMQMLDDITVLIAEDERSVRMLVRIVLEAAGARVVDAEHGHRALQLLELHPDVDVLVTDLNMPEMDGAALIEASRKLRPQLPVVTCSAMDLDDEYPTVRESSDAVVQKPFVPADLVRAVTIALERRSASRVAAC